MLWAKALPDVRHGEVVGFVITIDDVTAQRAQTQHLMYLATHDQLTGLYNRPQFLEFVRHAAGRQRRQQRCGVVLFIDVDDLKQTNDRLGHDAGDRLLRTVAARVSDAVRPADVVARYGGHEFTVLCEDLRDLGEATSIAERVPHVRRGADNGDGPFSLSCCARPRRRSREDPAATVELADQAKYRAKTACAPGGPQPTPHHADRGARRPGRDPSPCARSERWLPPGGARRPLLPRRRPPAPSPSRTALAWEGHRQLPHQRLPLRGLDRCPKLPGWRLRGRRTRRRPRCAIVLAPSMFESFTPGGDGGGRGQSQPKRRAGIGPFIYRRVLPRPPRLPPPHGARMTLTSPLAARGSDQSPTAGSQRDHRSTMTGRAERPRRSSRAAEPLTEEGADSWEPTLSSVVVAPVIVPFLSHEWDRLVSGVSLRHTPDIGAGSS